MKKKELLLLYYYIIIIIFFFSHLFRLNNIIPLPQQVKLPHYMVCKCVAVVSVRLKKKHSRLYVSFSWCQTSVYLLLVSHCEAEILAHAILVTTIKAFNSHKSII